MRIKALSAAIACLLLVLGTLTGCGSAASPQQETTAQQTPQAPAAAQAETSAAAETNTPTETAVPAEKEPETKAEAEPAPTWEELYEQGQKYFSEENYEEAIKAFTEAIGLDPDQAPVYVGRGDSYTLRQAEDDEDASSDLDKAWADYEKASDLDESCTQAFLGMADILIRREAFEEAYDLLGSVPDAIAEDPAILGKRQEIESGKYVDSSSQIRRMDQFDPNGKLISYTVYEYDFLGRKTGWRRYDCQSQDPGLELYVVVSFDENDLPVRNDFYEPDGTLSQHQTMEYDERGLEIRRDVYMKGEHMGYYLTYYDENGRETGYDTYDVKSGKMLNYWRYDYDENGDLLQQNCYSPEGKLLTTRKPSDE